MNTKFFIIFVQDETLVKYTEGQCCACQKIGVYCVLYVSGFLMFHSQKCQSPQLQLCHQQQVCQPIPSLKQLHCALKFTDTQCTFPLIKTTCVKSVRYCHRVQPEVINTEMCETGCDCPAKFVYNEDKECVIPSNCNCIMPVTNEVVKVWLLCDQIAHYIILSFPLQVGQAIVQGCHQFFCINNKLEKIPLACNPCDPNTEEADEKEEGACCPLCIEKPVPEDILVPEGP